jgi:TM2 domain-containing membrane protein YozV
MKNTNKLFVYILAAFLIFGGTAYASFPVKNESKKEQSTVTAKEELKAAQLQYSELANTIVKEDSKTTAKPADLDEKWILVLLWWFLGWLAMHRWYKKKPAGWNILYILTGGGCMIWAIVDLINIITDEF